MYIFQFVFLLILTLIREACARQGLEANQKNRSFLSLLQNRITPAQIDRSVLQTYVPIIG